MHQPSDPSKDTPAGSLEEQGKQAIYITHAEDCLGGGKGLYGSNGGYPRLSHVTLLCPC